MKKWLFLMPLLALLGSCGSFKPNDAQQKFISEFDRELKQPLIIDDVFIEKLDTLESMDLASLEAIKKDTMIKDLAGELKSSVEGCILIETKKQSGRYQGYLDSLNIGMLKNAMAFKIGKLQLDNKHSLLLWGINEASFEANPGYSGISIVASYANKQGGFTHVIVGEQYNAGDPPSMMERKVSADISGNELRITRRAVLEDLDSHSKETENGILKVNAEPGELKITQNVTQK